MSTEDPLARYRCEACLNKLRTGDCVEGRYRLCNACADSIAEWFRSRFKATSPSPEVEPDPIEPAAATATEILNDAAKERGLTFDPNLRAWRDTNGDFWDARPGPVFVKFGKAELGKLHDQRRRRQGK